MSRRTWLIIGVLVLLTVLILIGVATVDLGSPDSGRLGRCDPTELIKEGTDCG